VNIIENNVTQRFREFMGSTGLSILAFANAIGIPQSTLNQQLNGRNGKNIGVQISVITATLSAYPDLSAEWLLRGEGEMKKGAEWQVTQFVPVHDTELVDALKDHIATLKGENERLRKEMEEYKRDKIAAPIEYSSVAADGK
jgi:transcriptional regulator with XRE-family HTH domain